MKTLTKAALAATVATGLFASPAFAAPAGNSQFTAKAVIVKPVTITKATDLDFGITTMNPSLISETVTVGDATGDVAVCGSTQLTCSGGFPASFNLTSGVGNEIVQISFDTPPTQLDHTTIPGSSVPFTLNPVEDVTLDATGKGKFNVGGQITVVPGTDDGVYKATVKITANYL